MENLEKNRMNNNEEEKNKCKSRQMNLKSKNSESVNSTQGCDKSKQKNKKLFSSA